MRGEGGREEEREDGWKGGSEKVDLATLSRPIDVFISIS